jgi:hypothetical protein
VRVRLPLQKSSFSLATAPENCCLLRADNHLVGNPKREFLTHKTTCTTEMLEKTTCPKICQKRPPISGGMAGQATRGTCRLGRCRHGGAASSVTGMWPASSRRRTALAQVGPAAITVTGMVTWHHAASPIAGTLPCACADSRRQPQKRPALTSMQKERS